ncbi:hypothetical protein M8J77_000226 [Diaphorina citri]|nr:hypothetical protein M8J77_000226 [Diaphorina citri]
MVPTAQLPTQSRPNWISDSCPECRSAAQDVPNLFNCPAHPTRLDPTWTNPGAAATFLDLDRQSAAEELKTSR